MLCDFLQEWGLRGVLSVHFSISLVRRESGQDSFDVPSCKHAHATSFVVAVGTAEAGVGSVDPLAVPVVACWESVQVMLPFEVEFSCVFWRGEVRFLECVCG